jgi:DNA-binding transcriptional MerR regulator
MTEGSHQPTLDQQLYPNVRVETGGVWDAAPPGTRRGQGRDVDGKHMQIGEVAARTELSLRTIRHYEETGLVVPSARSQGGFRLYTEADVARLMVIRRMKPLGFTLDEMRALLEATDRLDTDDAPAAVGEREELLERVRGFEEIAQQRVADLRTQLARAEEFADTLRRRLTEAEASAQTP